MNSDSEYCLISKLENLDIIKIYCFNDNTVIINSKMEILACGDNRKQKIVPINENEILYFTHLPHIKPFIKRNRFKNTKSARNI